MQNVIITILVQGLSPQDPDLRGKTDIFKGDKGVDVHHVSCQHLRPPFLKSLLSLE